MTTDPLVLLQRAARSLALLLCTALVAPLAPAAVPARDEPLFHFQEGAGPYPVGLQVIEQYDRSRTFRSAVDDLGQPYRGERARPLQTLVWYPAEHSGNRTMTVQDYLSLWTTVISFGQPRVTVRFKEWSSGLGPTLAMPLRAVRDAPPVTGAGASGARFPVIIYAPGASNPSWENADLCEYLASHGYVVIAGPSLGARTLDMVPDLEGANTQAADISFLIGYAQTRSDTDTSRVAVAGMSWGGLANLFAAARDNRISALIALDGSMRYYPGIVQAGGVHPERLTIPLLAFQQAAYSLEDQERYTPATGGRNVLNAWTHGDLLTVHMMGVTHSGFTSVYPRNEDFWWQLTHVYPLWAGDYGRADEMTGYAWVARYTLRFLDAYLKHDPQAQAFLKTTPAENGVPPHVMAVNYRAGQAQAPATFEAYRAEVGRQGFEHASDVYATFQAQDPKFALDPAALTDWSDELITDKHLTEALALLKFNLGLHPESNAAYVQLGSAYELAGQKQIAIKNYQEALARGDGSNLAEGEARRKLNELLSREDLAKH